MTNTQLVKRARDQVELWPNSTPQRHLISQLADALEAADAECFKLAAGVCEYRGGNEHGNPLCLKTNQLI